MMKTIHWNLHHVVLHSDDTIKLYLIINIFVHSFVIEGYFFFLFAVLLK